MADLESTHPISSEADLVRDLSRIGVAAGDHLAVGVSYKRIGKIMGGPQALIDALLEVVGPSGTVMFNTYTRKWPLRLVRAGRIDRVFDYRKTPAISGIVSELFRQRPEAVRSRHPTNSVAAIGARATFLTASHDASAPAYAPYSDLAAAGGKMICIGIGDQVVGLRHQAQYLAGLLTLLQPMSGTLHVGRDGRQALFIRTDPGGCTTKLPDLVAELREQGFVRDGRIGQAASSLLSVRESLEGMAGSLRDRPEASLCGDCACLWCREVERHLDLYDRFEQPAWFQRRGPSRMLLRGINQLRLNNVRGSRRLVTWLGHLVVN